MSDISQQIDKIIDCRKEKLNCLQKVQETIEIVFKKIQNFKLFQSELYNNQEGLSGVHNENEIAERIMGISTDNFERLYNSYTSYLQLLIKRLSRDNLHISFVGSAGQGKSLVMQNISGLSKSVIPSSDGGDCTGAQSIIINSNSDNVSAEIVFYTETEIVGIINQYLLQLTNGTQSIRYASDIPEINIDFIKKHLLEGVSPKKEEWLDYLSKYVKYFDEYSKNLGKKITVSEDEIEQYVAQYSNSDINHEYHQYLSVKVANISKRFPYSDAGKIVLVDTVGLGTTCLDTEKEMLKAVKEDSDAIIFMQCPNDRRGRISQDEIDALESIIGEVGSEYTKEMLFWVLNRVESGDKQPNGKQVECVMKEIRQKNYAIAMPLDVDCYNKEEVKNKLLIPVLKQLSSKIGVVDNFQIETLNKKGKELFSAYAHICQITDQAFISSATQDLKRKFHDRILQTYNKKLLFWLRDLYLHKYNELRNKPCEELMEATKGKLKHVIQSVLTEEEVLDLLSNGGENQINAYEHSTHIMRMRIIDDFTQLNSVLDSLVENMKKDVINIFIDSEIGRLGYIYPMNGTSSEWIDGFIEYTEAEIHYPVIASAFRKFQAYGINVQGFLIHEIRDKLDPIDIALTPEKIPVLNEQLTRLDLVAKQIVEWLKTNIEEVYDNIKNTLSQLYTIPNRSMFAAIKDLADRVTYTRNDGENIVAYEWQCLYEDWIHMIWKEDYEKENSLRSFADRWIQVASDIKEVNDISYFTIKN